MDNLQKSAESFARLLDKSYHIVAGSKNKKIFIDLYFSKEHFFHLLGLHKLSDIDVWNASKNKEMIFDSILNNDITYDHICRSSFFDEIMPRLTYFFLTENVLDSNDIVISYNKNRNKSSITAKYLITYKFNNNYLHWFIDTDKKSGKSYLRTFFPRLDTDYIDCQRKYKVLQKVKNNITTGDKIIICDKLTQVK